MTQITDETRQKYKELKAKADAAYDAAEPQREALSIAEQPWNELQDEIDELLDGAEPTTCDFCMEPIFDGDKSMAGEDGSLCEKCSPTYGDITKNPAHFQNAEGEPMTDKEAKELVDTHLAAGGSLNDTLAV